MSDSLLTTGETAAFLGLLDNGRSRAAALRKIQRLARSGELPYVKKMPRGQGEYLFDRHVVEMFARQLAKAAAS